MIDLTVVGCSGSASGPDSPASAYLFQADHQGRTFSLLLDLGPGAFGTLYRYLDPSTVDAVGFSHLHPDHCFDLCAFYVGARYSATAPWPVIDVYGPTGTQERLRSAYEVSAPDGRPSEGGVSIAEQFTYRTWATEQQIGPFTVVTTQVAHPVETYAIRVSETAARGAERGGSIVFSGDTGPCAALIDLARGADLLLVEAAFVEAPDNRINLHLTGRQAAETGQAAGVGQVLLTHIPPWHSRDQVLAEATPHFDGPVALAEAGQRWSIGPGAARS